jgi:hypothetical protein
MTDIKIGYTTSDYFYTLEPEKVPDHQTCETLYTVYFDNSCSFFPLNSELSRCRDKNQNTNDFKNCLSTVDSEKGTNYVEQYQTWLDSSNNCYKTALCKNRKYAEKIQEQQTRHLGTNEHYNNVKSILINEQWKTLHLGFGILGIIGAAYLLNKQIQTSSV